MLPKLKTPLILIAVFASLILIWEVLNLPSSDALIEIVTNYFLIYGPIIVLLAAIIEGMLLVGVYIPGGTVIFLGVSLASGHPQQALLAVLMTIIGLTIAYTINYFLGRYGWYKVILKFGLRDALQKSETSFVQNGYKAIYMSYWLPNLASLTSTGAGILHINFKKFFINSTLATILWSSFWGTTAYYVGDKVLTYLGPIFFAVMLGWIISIIWGNYKAKKLS